MKVIISSLSVVFLLTCLSSIEVKAKNSTAGDFIKTVSTVLASSEFQSKKVAIYGDTNDYKPAGYEDIANVKMDADLKNIISRVVKIDPSRGNRYGSGFITGDTCDKVITAKHNTHYGQFENSPFELINKSYSVSYKGNAYRLVDVPVNLSRWSVHDDVIQYTLSSGVKNLSCPKVPKVKHKELLGLLGDGILSTITCKSIGYPNKSIFENVDGQMKSFGTYFSGVPKVGGGEYPSSKRGINDCNILHVSPKGKIFHDCDNLPGASGGPIVCKHNSRWKLVGIMHGGACTINGVSAHELCYKMDKGLEITTESDDNKVFGTAASMSKITVPNKNAPRL